MYNDQPIYSYQEYEQSIAEALQRSVLVGKPRPPIQPPAGAAWRTLRAALTEMLDHIDRRVQPAEEGYLA